MTSHRDQLREALVGAAGRQITARARRQRITRAGGGAVVVLIIAIAVFIGLNAVDTEPALADTFEIQRTGDDVLIDVIGSVDDPDDARAELAAAGISATLEPRLAAPSLQGVVVAAETFGLDSVTVDGTRVEQIRLDARQVELTIYYGAPAGPGEPHLATESVPNCTADYARHPALDILEQIRADYGPDLRVPRIITTGAQEVTADQPSADIVVAVLPLSQDQAMVLVSQDDPDQRLAHLPATPTTRPTRSHVSGRRCGHDIDSGADEYRVAPNPPASDDLARDEANYHPKRRIIPYRSASVGVTIPKRRVGGGVSLASTSPNLATDHPRSPPLFGVSRPSDRTPAGPSRPPRDVCKMYAEV